MKHLYRIQTLLVVVFSLLALPWASSQISEPLVVFVKNSGTVFSDQFPGNTDYVALIVDDVSPALGSASIAFGGQTNTFIVTFTPNAGVKGSTDLIVSYYSLSIPVHPVTRSYRFVISDEVVLTGQDRYLVDSGAVEIPFLVLENDSTTGSTLTLTNVVVANSGSAIIDSAGTALLFTPDADFSGDTWIQYIACDTAGNCGEGKVHILVRDPLDQNVRTYKKYLLNREQLEVITPFEDYSIQIAPGHGTLDAIDSISWLYTPEEGFVGTDTFELALQNLINRKYIVTVYEKAVNIQAKDDKFYVRPGLSVSFNVLNNDLLDFDITSFTNPSKGTLNDLGNGLYTYSPNTGYRGVDKFTYTTCFEDTVYCETATVLLHVTDLEPENVFTYKLQTTADLPLTIDYPVIYTDFAYIISEDPANGTFTSFPGVQEIHLPCDTIEAYNMLVYTPDPGFTGADHFEYYYCITASNICYLVKIDIEVVPAPEPETCPCIVDCVWPGDSDADGRVDMNDLLTLGYRLGTVGPVRGYIDPSAWFGQHADAWPVSGTGAGIQYLDGNGDGAITSADVDVISNQYYRTHDVVVRDVQQKLPYQFSIIPVQFSLDSGDVVILDISFGNANVPVLDMKGAKFSVNMPPLMMDSTTVEVIFHQYSWLAEGSPNIFLGKVPWDGRIDAGFVKANGNSSSGFGVIGTVVFIIEQDIEGFKSDDGLIQIPVTLGSGVVMGSDGTLYEVEGDEIYLTLDPYKTNQNPYQLILYPNPAQDLVNIHLNGKTSIETISMYDTQGRLINTLSDINSKHHEMNVSSLPVGLYYLQVQHEHGVMTQVLSVIR